MLKPWLKRVPGGRRLWSMARILYGSRYHVWRNPQLLEQMMRGKTWTGGASFWFEYRGTRA